MVGRRMAAPPTAAIVLIGDELLSAKIRDENGWFLAQRLRFLGIALVEVAMVPDEPARIGASIERLAPLADIIFTSGGVGPTHDDRTLEAIAQATGRPLQRSEPLEAHLRKHYGGAVSPDALRMADLPSGTQLRATDSWPVLRLDWTEAGTRLYILPGVPSLLRIKLEQLEAIDGELPRSGGWHGTSVLSSIEESSLAPVLDHVVESFPEVSIGSYPRWTRSASGALEYSVRITFEAPMDLAQRAEQARAKFIEAMAARHGPGSTMS